MYNPVDCVLGRVAVYFLLVTLCVCVCLRLAQKSSPHEDACVCLTLIIILTKMPTTSRIEVHASCTDLSQGQESSIGVFEIAPRVRIPRIL